YIHPRLSRYFKEEIKNYSLENTLIYDIPLLFEKNLQEKTDVSICVYSEKEILKRRLMKRDGIDQNLAGKMLKQQLSMEEKKEKAQFTIENNKDLQTLKNNTLQLIQEVFE
ncbi:MAG: dephospho-CoA kinase, partial [Halobacteriovoraceae bacterium]|nr:dephospho-CoA kinase [Halobacteriovoraceae bacterium]